MASKCGCLWSNIQNQMTCVAILFSRQLFMKLSCKTFARQCRLLAVDIKHYIEKCYHVQIMTLHAKIPKKRSSVTMHDTKELCATTMKHIKHKESSLVLSWTFCSAWESRGFKLGHISSYNIRCRLLEVDMASQNFHNKSELRNAMESN